MKSIKKLDIPIIFFTLILVVCPIFLFLGSDYIQLWDEGRNALNALDMYWYGFSFVTYYENLPDLWNTKPPLLIWLQVLSMEIFGVNEFSIRFPSAMAALSTCGVLFVFIKKFIGNQWLSILTVLILVTSTGYISIHGARTGDFDTLLTLFTTTYCLCFFYYLHTRNKYLILSFFIFLSLAVLTKSVAGLFFLPAIGIYTLLTKNISILKDRYFYMGLLLFLLMVGGYYITRESLNPGYLQAVYDNELGGRAFSALEGNDHGRWYYLENLYSGNGAAAKRFSYWIFIFPIGLLAGLVHPNKKVKQLTFYCFLLLVTHFSILTIAATKLHWYDTPWYPFLAIITAMGGLTLIECYRQKKLADFTDTYQSVLRIGVLLLLLICYPYTNIIRKISDNTKTEWFRNQDLITVYLKDVFDGKHELDPKLKIYNLGSPYSSKFYINLLNDKGADISIIKDWRLLKEEDIVLLGHGQKLKDDIENNFNVDILEDHQSDWSHWGLKKYRIISRKD